MSRRREEEVYECVKCGRWLSEDEAVYGNRGWECGDEDCDEYDGEIEGGAIK